MFKSAPARLLLWCLAGTALAQAAILAAPAIPGLSPIFRVLLTSFDPHGNVVLLAITLAAFFLRRREAPLALVRFAGERPWPIAAMAFVALCAGSLLAYHNQPLSMDEYVPLFQAHAFAAARLHGEFPPPLMDLLVPEFFQGRFFTVSHRSGAVVGQYWPAFGLLLTPFAWLGVPWAANPALGALAVPLVHRLALRLAGSREAAGWAVLLALASPAFIVQSISYYSMQANLVCNALFVVLLLTPSPGRAALAGVVGSVALTLHNPIPHLLFSLAFLARLAWRREVASLAALAAGYAPLCVLLGAGWYEYLGRFAGEISERGGHVFASGSAAGSAPAILADFLRVPDLRIVYSRIAGLAKLWTWASAGLLVLAAMSLRDASAQMRVLAWAFAITFFGYFLVRFDQGHGWGYRYLHAAWFVLPVLGAAALAARPELKPMAAWCVALSLVLANGLRLVQVEGFIARHLAQVPPLARAPERDRREIVFVNLRAGFYAQDLLQNDPFLRGPRMIMVYAGPAATAALMNSRFPAYARQAAGEWGELWSAKVD